MASIPMRGVLISALATLAAASAWAQTERVIQVPSGTYDFAQILTQSGTAENWIRYRPAVPGGVTIRGGEIIDKQYIILDGFTIDGRLDPEWPGKSRGVVVRTGHHVTVTNSEIIGPADIHTGFDITGQPNCKEAEGFPTQSGGVGTLNETEAITFSNLIVHGFYGAGSLRGKRDLVVNSLFRNNFNGLSISSLHVAIVDNVFWVHPNHLFSLQGAGTVQLMNNLLVDGQDMFNTGSGRAGAANASMLHNTFWIPANKPCYGFTGMNLTGIGSAAEVRDNILVNKEDGFIGVVNASVPPLQSDYNLFYNYRPTTQEFNFAEQQLKVSVDTWRTQTGRDTHSIAREAPVFTNPPQYADASANQWGFRIPASVAEARAWLSLQAGSPGKHSASDGLDRGVDSRFDSHPISLPPVCAGSTGAARLPPGVTILSFDPVAQRSNPLGWRINFELSAQPGWPLTRVIVDLVEDGERPLYDVTVGDMDVHAMRGLFVKPVVNGTFTVLVTAVDRGGCAGESDRTQRVSVTF